MKFGGTVAGPVDGLGALLVGEGIDFDLAGDHEGGVKTESEVSDDLVVGGAFVFFDEFFGAGEGDLVDVFFDLVGGHADAVVGDGEGFFVFIDADDDFGVAEFAVDFAGEGDHFEFGDGVYGVGDQFAEKYFVVGVERFLDNGKNIFSMDGDRAFFEYSHGG